MNTDALIRELARGGSPVAPIRATGTRFLIWLAATAPFLLGAVALLGPRPELRAALLDVRFLAKAALTLGLAMSSAYAALAWSVPGERRRGTACVAAVLAGLTAGFFLLELALTSAAAAGDGLHCLRNVALLGSVPGLLLLYLAARAAPLRRGMTAALALAGAAAAANLATFFVCQNENPLHLLLWHLGPGAVIAGLGFALGKLVFARLV